MTLAKQNTFSPILLLNGASKQGEAVARPDIAFFKDHSPPPRPYLGRWVN